MRKPIKRSLCRSMAGKAFYTVKKQFYWSFGGDFAKKEKRELQRLVFKHQTLLRRKLAGVPMRLQENKITNLKLAASKLDRVLIKPGQVFSFWKLLSKPTRDKGYVEGMILRDGKFAAGIGGGLCQMSNLIYWMSLHTPLTVIERWRHGYDVFPDASRKQPFGSGATCAYPYIDLQIKNDTNREFQLRLEVLDDYLAGSWMSDQDIDYNFEVYERDHEIKQELFGEYSRNNRIYRKLIDKKSGDVISDELIAENHALMMYKPLIG